MIYSALPPNVDITRDFLMAQRQALLLQLEAIELLLSLSPRTSELRSADKAARKLQAEQSVYRSDEHITPE